MSFWDEIKKEVFTDENKKRLGSFSRKTKAEISKLPIISIIGDTTQGAAGLGEVKELVKKEPNNPKNWLFYYEAYMTHLHLKGGVSVARGIINPIGFIAGKGLATGLNTIDDEYQKFDPKQCLYMVMSIVSKRIKEKSLAISDLVVYAKSQFYLAVKKSGEEREALLKHAIKNITLAIEKESKQSHRAELFFYLSQMYKEATRMELYCKSLNISRKLGFLPAYKELASLLKKGAEKTVNENAEHIRLIEKLENKCSYTEFNYTFKLNFATRVDNTFKHVVSEQSKKISETKKRLSKFLNQL